MHEASVERQSPLLAVANALTKLHKEQFGRGPTSARAYFAGPDMLVCALSDALLPAERNMTRLGMQEQVRHTRVSFQAATRSQFIAAIEVLIPRTVTAFASAVDPDSSVIFENFHFAPEPAEPAHRGAVDGGRVAGRGRASAL
jgi:uncharacterized protein YbcI